MNTLVKLRLVVFDAATQKGILGGEKLADVPFVSEVVDDLVCRVMDDLYQYNTFAQFDPECYDLFRRAFLYLFGKGAEYAFFARMEYEMPRFPYHFDAFMRGQGATKLPEYVRAQLDHQRTSLLAVYEAAVAFISGSRAERRDAGLELPRCMYVVLSGAFFCGREFMLTLEPQEEDGNFAFDEDEVDMPYDPDSSKYTYSHGDFTAVRRSPQ